MRHNKVTRLTERDLNRLVRRIIRENEMENEEDWQSVPCEEAAKLEGDPTYEVKVEDRQCFVRKKNL